MANKHFIKQPTDIVLERLSVYFEKLNLLYKGNNITDSELIDAYQEALDRFLSSIDSSSVDNYFEIIPGLPANPVEYNDVFDNLGDDLKGLYYQLRALDLLTVSSFNSVIAEHDQIQQLVKETGNRLGDYLLYSDNTIGGGFFFGDSFSSAHKLSIGSDLVSGDECFVSPEEGVVLLPLDGDPERTSSSISINANSNGVAGNNFQIDAPGGHDALEALLDNEPNTWFEYEKVVSSYSDVPLILDLTFALTEEKIINHIHINPINFGTPTPLKINKIETSRDGKEFMSIKDEIPIKDFVPEEEDNVFELSAASSKYSGQGFYSFLPRKTKFVHIRFQQDTPYPIDTNSGVRLRYAIGLRDINILSRTFKPSGSLVSDNFSSTNEIKKVSMWASENPSQASSLSDISHFISHDDGSSWSQIQPQGRFQNNIPEVIDFNTIDEDSISTENPVHTLRHKIEMNRSDDAFSGNVTLKQERLPKFDIVSIPSIGQDSISVKEEPIESTVNVIAPFYGSFSCPRPKYGDAVAGESPPMELDFVSFKVDTPDTGTLRFKLPFFDIDGLEDKVRVFVNGEQIEHAPKNKSALDAPSHLSNKILTDGAVDENSKVYFLNKGGKELQFGWTDEDGEQRGFIPGSGSKISVCLDGDNPTLELVDNGYIISLSAPSDGIKENVKIVAIDTFDENEATDYEIVIPPGFSKYVGPKLARPKLLPGIKPQYSKAAPKFSSLSNVKLATKPVVRVAHEYEEDNYYYTDDYDYEGLTPPVFLSNDDDYEIKEYDLNGNLIESPYFSDRVPFVDGESELRGPYWDKVPTRYTFDADTGTVYLGSTPKSDRKTVLVCKKQDTKLLSPDMWRFNKDVGTNKINTKEILLDPKAVFTKKITHVHDGSDTVNSISLFNNEDNSHDWTKKKIVRKTVKIDKKLFPKNSKPLEVPFVDGESEFTRKQTVEKEDITFVSAGTDLYSFTLSQIDSNNVLVGSLLFGTRRSSSSASTVENKFTKEVTTTPTAEGEWLVENDGTTVTVTLYTESEPTNHFVSYKYKSTDSGLSSSSLYSIDYDSGVIHFADNIINEGNITFEASMYSVFYNISKEIEPRFIEKIDTTNKTIMFKSSYLLNSVKLDTALAARPQYFVVLYDYYKKSTESLADLKPYFSPICKDVAFKSVTSDVLEEL